MPLRVSREDIVPGIGEFVRGDDGNGDRVLRRPTRRLVEQHSKFHRQRLPRLRRVHACAECLERLSRRAIGVAPLARSDAFDVDGAQVFVHAKRFDAENLGEGPVRVPPRQIHLKEPVGPFDEPLREEQIVQSARANVRNASAVACDGDVVFNRQARHRPVHLRARAHTDCDIGCVKRAREQHERARDACMPPQASEHGRGP